MALLFDQRKDNHITKEVIIAITRLFDEKMIEMMLDGRGNNIKITEEIMTAAAGNHRNGKEVITLLLDLQTNQIKITEEVLKAAAGNEDNGEEVL